MDVTSDDLTVASSGSPPPKRTKKLKPSKKHTKKKLVSRERKRMHSESRKRQRLSSSPSDSSLASTTGSSSSNSSSHLKRLTKKRKQSKMSKVCKSEVKRSVSLLDVFQKHYKSLVTLIKSCPVAVSSALYSKGFIFEDTLNQVITGQDSHLNKASLLLSDVRAHLNVNPEMLLEFVQLLHEQGKSFDCLVNQLKDDISLVPRGKYGHPIVSSMSKDISQYREYLMCYYDNDAVLRDDKLSIAPCSQFINLAIVNKSDVKDKFSKSTFYGGVDQIIASKSPIDMDNIILQKTRFVLVEGAPGIGKSTLCWELCRKWDDLKSFQFFDIVLLLKLRERRVLNAASLNDLFYHENKKLSRKVMREVSENEGKKVLFILDGFDEVPSSVIRDESCLIMRLIRGQCLPSATRLVTSRPSALHRTKYFPQNYRHVEILGFTDDHKQEFAEIAFQSEPKVRAHFMDFVISNPVINSLMYIPVNCAIIAQVYKEIKERNILPKTMTQLYTTLTLVLIRRFMIEKGQWDEESRIPRKIHDLIQEDLKELEKVGALAYRGLFKEDVQLVFTDCDIPDSIQYFGLLKESKEMYVSEGVATSYSFLHLSIQEFLAAWYVSYHPDLFDETIAQTFEKPDTVGSQVSVKSHLNAFGRFLSGMIGCNKFPIKFGSLDASLFNDDGYIINCFYESQDPKYLSTLPKTFWNLSLRTSLDMYIFGYTLIHAPIQWDISFLTHADMLLRSLADSVNSNKMLGCIESIQVNPGEVNYILPNLEKLPFQTLRSLTLFGVLNSTIENYCTLVSSFLNLQRLHINFVKECEDDHLLLKLLKQLCLKDFDLDFTAISDGGIQAVIEFISASSTLEYLRIASQFREEDNCISKEEWDYHYLAEAAVCSPTIKFLNTNIPYRCFSKANQIQKLDFALPDNHMCISSMSVHDSYCSIATMSKKTSFASLRFDFYDISLGTSKSFLLDTLLIINQSLHFNSALKFKLDNFKCHFQLFFSILLLCLRKDPDIVCMNLERSRSLCTLTTLGEELGENNSLNFLSEASSGNELEDNSEGIDSTAFPKDSSCPGFLGGEQQDSYSTYLEDSLEDIESTTESAFYSTSPRDNACQGFLEEEEDPSSLGRMSFSCPDFSVLDSMDAMHPVLYKELVGCLDVQPSKFHSMY